MGCYYDLLLVLLLLQSWSHSITENIQLEIIKVALLNIGKLCNKKNPIYTIKNYILKYLGRKWTMKHPKSLCRKLESSLDYFKKKKKT